MQYILITTMFCTNFNKNNLIHQKIIINFLLINKSKIAPLLPYQSIYYGIKFIKTLINKSL